MSVIVPIILAGGSGSRLWPLSREHYPKQLISLAGKASLFQETIERVAHIKSIEAPLVICNKEYRFLIAEQMRAVGIIKPQLILESVGRNTAPAIAIAALIVSKIYPDTDPLLLVLPADHLLDKPNLFAEYLQKTIPLAKEGHLITFGIKPTYAEQGYGYIEAGAEITPCIHKITKFIEKPPLDEAEQYFKADNYYWNSGMFFFQASTYLHELKKYRPPIFNACQAEAQAIAEIGGSYYLSENFNRCPAESIDYAVMEHTDNALVSPLPLNWSDVGSWSALLDILPKDEQGNILQGDVTAIDVHDCFIRSEGRLVAVAGLKDHIVVETPDAVMVAHKDYAQNIKNLFNDLKAKARSEVVQHKLVNRPWGSYETLTEGPFYRVKHVIVKPGASLSAQAHKYRSEHWIVLKGCATIIVAGINKRLNTYESTFIPVNQLHQLCNHTTEPLEIIEVQAGTFLSEEDIYHED